MVVASARSLGRPQVGPHLQWASLWGPTLYTNSLSIAPMATIGVVTGEAAKLDFNHGVSAYALLAL
eukprot:2953188-Prymnesium_polylepis.1